MKLFRYQTNKICSKSYHPSFKSLKIIFLVLFLFLVCNTALAATLSFSPSTRTYTVGSSITVNILVSSSDKIMNAASGNISFPTNLLSVSSISKEGSIVNFWAQEPSFSNVTGSVNFEGVLLPPGFIGNSGKLLTVIFKTKSAGQADLNFISSSVLAADGNGTNILASSGSASFQIVLGEAQPTIITPVTPGVPGAPEIISTTHPDSTKWYTIADASFSWNVNKDTLGVSVLLDGKAKSSPIVLYDPPIVSKEVNDLEDGIWYFHAQLKNDKGWGAIAHYKIQIDTEKPISFDITEIKRADPTDPLVKFIFDAVDETSGIDHYEVKIDTDPVENWQPQDSQIYETTVKKGGVHSILVRAVDKAGNFLVDVAEFNVKALDAPIITDYPREVVNNEMFTVVGTTKYPNSQANLFLQNENGVLKNYSAKVDKTGNFSITSSNGLRNGLYTAWVEITDSRGAKSLPSEVVTIYVKQSTLISIGSWVVNILAVIIPLLALIFLLIFLLWYVWHRFIILKKKTKKGVTSVKTVLHKVFGLLNVAIKDHIKILEKTREKRELTADEEEIIKQLEKNLDNAENVIKEELEDL